MNAARNRTSAVAAVALTLLLAACGGGSGSSSTASVPGVRATQTPAANGPTAQVSLRINAGTVTTSSTARKPQYVSAATASVTITLQNQSTPLTTVNLTQTSPQCSNNVCTVTFNAPIGNDTFIVTTFDGQNGTGNQLSTAIVTATVAANATNTVSVALNGIVAQASVVLSTTSAAVGTPVNVTVNVVALDASGNVIVGPGNYSTPVSLTDSDSSGATHLSANSIAAPGATVTLAYTGGSIGSGATITPSVGNQAGTAQTFTPSGYVFANFDIAGTGGESAETMAAGPDGNVWFSSYGLLGYVTPSGGNTVFNANDSTNIYGLAVDATQTIWFGDSDADLGTVSTAGTVQYLTDYSTVLPDANDCGSQEGSKARAMPQARRRIAGGDFGPSPVSILCGGVNYMAKGPDGNLWFSDTSGYIGQITPGGSSVTEWDISELPGFSGNYPAPEQFAFGADGNIYVANYEGLVDQIVLSGDVPVSVTTMYAGASCVSNGAYGIGFTADNTMWISECANLYALALGTPVNAANFQPSNLQSWSLQAISNGDSIGFVQASSGGLFGIDYDNAFIYRINLVSGGNTAPGVNALQPAIATVTPTGLSGSPYALTLGPDTNLWVGYDTGGDIDATRVGFGAPPVGAQQLVRSLPHAVNAVARNAAKLQQRRQSGTNVHRHR